MKKMLFLWLLLQPIALHAWQGDVSKFTQTDDVLMLDAPAIGDTAYVSEPTRAAVNACWDVTIRLQYVPSSSNLVRFYLMADTTCLDVPLQGYFVQVGGAKRTLSLHRQDGVDNTTLLSVADDLLAYAPVDVHLRVYRSLQKEWYFTYALDSGVWLSSDSIMDDTYLVNKAWGVWCKYTKTRNKAFAFSNFLIRGDVCENPTYEPISNLFITEILYDPLPQGVDFVELYNASDTLINLGRCSLSNGKKQVKLPAYNLLPDSYVAITTVDSVLLEHYPDACCENLLQLPSMPNFVNDSGVVAIYSSNHLVDSVRYSDKMHHDWLHDAEGFSLERVPFDGNNWFSASSEVMATPGCANSQATILPPDVSSFDKPFWLSDNWFVPNEQYLRIYHRVEEGSIANAWVYDLQGVPVYRMYNNTLLSALGDTYWDGRDDAGYLCSVGIYVVVVQWQTLSGKMQSVKMPVALGE